MSVQEEGFHEIQLNGKQVVFLFMAATVVSVVIFLCGVLVGRGVRVERTVAEAAPGNSLAETTPPPQPAAAPTPTPAGSDPRSAAPPPPSTDDLSYFKRLENKTPPREQLKPEGDKSGARVADKTAPERTPVDKAPVEKAAPPKPALEKSAPEKTVVAIERPAPPPPPAKEPPRAPVAVALAPPPPPPPPAPTADDTGGAGFAVQIAALNVKGEAEAIAKRLTSKGYSAYVLMPADGTPSVYRVRIGKFPTRREADTVAAKLKKEEQFNPWVTR